MAQSTAGTAKDLNDGRAEALQALLSSLSPPGVQSSSSTKLSPAQLQNLSNKIDELLGGADAPNGPHRNEKGETSRNLSRSR
ncbi:hypothetical protein BV22DRAFT_339942 [Leucogyrophana mollusca]|uniref:Uncharacterized protein n=1 Tax=Leucogyrophana mollusca TaxID=85980 RepID=A0ACB8BLP9_9AGAM|nr:hypothetical protein BV22DRAFT_339942 [Leucogyrophana mollusca]